MFNCVFTACLKLISFEKEKVSEAYTRETKATKNWERNTLSKSWTLSHEFFLLLSALCYLGDLPLR